LEYNACLLILEPKKINITFESLPLTPVNIDSFTKTSTTSLSWAVDQGRSCVISSDQNDFVLNLGRDSSSMAGSAIHNLPEETTFTLTCDGFDTSTASESTDNTFEDLFPETLGYFGRPSSLNSWAAIVNLTTPITFSDQIDFNTQVNTYCTNLGYIGVAQTMQGDFATNNTHFFQSAPQVVDFFRQSNVATLIPNDQIFNNVFTNRENRINEPVVRATISNGQNEALENTEGSTSGENQTVLCQTDVPVAAALGLERVSTRFLNEETFDRVLGFDEPFTIPIIELDRNDSVQYTSSDNSIASVDQDGLVTLTGVGNVTITAVIAADEFFNETITSFTFESLQLQPVIIESFTKTSATSLSWVVNQGLSCVISNDENNFELNLSRDLINSASGVAHNLPEETTFTLTCDGLEGSTTSESTGIIFNDLFPETLGYIGSSVSTAHSWAAIVNLNTPITFVSPTDFNTQVDAYCTDLGYIGVAQTMEGDFATNDTHFVETRDNVSRPLGLVTLIPGNQSFDNVNTNRSNLASDEGTPISAVYGNNQAATNGDRNTESPTSVENQRVLCQTDLLVRSSIGAQQFIDFLAGDLVVRTLGVDEPFTVEVIGLNGEETIEYTSSDTSIATVDQQGLVTLVGVGVVTISLTIIPDDFFIGTTISYRLESRPM